MKVRALKSFVSGRISGNTGDIINVPVGKGHKLASIGFVEVIESGKAKNSTKPEPPKNPELPKEEVAPVQPKKKARTKKTVKK